MSSWQVSQLLEIAHRLATTLEAGDGEDRDEEPLAEALRAEGIDPDQLMRRLGRSVVEDEDMALAIDARIEALRSRRDRRRQRAAHKRTALSVVLQTLSMKRFVDTDFTASVRENKGGAVIVAPEDVPKLEPRFQRITIAANLAALKEALLNGEVVEHASLSQGGDTILTVRKT